MQRVTWTVTAMCILSAGGNWACEDNGDTLYTSTSSTTNAGSSAYAGANSGAGAPSTSVPAGAGGDGSGGAGGNGGAGGDDAANPVLNDAQIASVCITANTGEVTQGMVALESAQGEAARSFATDMVDMHSAALEREQALVASLEIEPQDNLVSRSLETQTNMAIATFKSASKAVFDSTYLQSQVGVHANVLTLIDDTLLPQVANAKLKDELTTLRQTVSMHLDRARQLIATGER